MEHDVPSRMWKGSHSFRDVANAAVRLFSSEIAMDLAIVNLIILVCGVNHYRIL
jgi:hypothetical protein